MTIPQLNVTPLATPSASAASGASAASSSDPRNFWGDKGAFRNMLDILNPLQHLPIVSTIYQSLTGDSESAGARIAGGTLYGGPIGLAVSVANEIVQTQTGKDVSGHLVALVTGDSGNAVQVAQNDGDATASYLSPNQRAAYNAYVKTQNMVA